MTKRTPKVPFKPLVIVAEDDPDIREIVAEHLRAEGFEIACAENGFIAWNLLETLFAEKGQGSVYAIISDLMMPKINGMELLEKIRGERGRFSNVPFVVMSGALTQDVVRQLISKDVDSVLAKPFELEKLVEAIEDSVRRRLAKAQALGAIDRDR